MKDFNITVTQTKHPSILKFEANHFLVKDNYEYANIDEAKNSPLAQQLFHLPFVKSVYISSNFVAIQKYDIVEWEEVKNEVAQNLVDYLNEGRVVVQEAQKDKPLPYTVYAEVTPNPAVMKYVTNKLIVPDIFEFKNIDEAKESPLAQALFHFPFVKEVFMDKNYISITKYEVAEWEEVSMEIREFIRTYLSDGKPVLTENAKSASPENSDNKTNNIPEYDDISKQIIAILDEYVKPAVASDGGNILFQSYEEETKKVNVILQGACSGCPSSTFTLKNGIETMLKNMLGEKVQEVVALNG